MQLIKFCYRGHRIFIVRGPNGRCATSFITDTSVLVERTQTFKSLKHALESSQSFIDWISE